MNGVYSKTGMISARKEAYDSPERPSLNGGSPLNEQFDQGRRNANGFTPTRQVGMSSRQWAL